MFVVCGERERERVRERKMREREEGGGSRIRDDDSKHESHYLRVLAHIIPTMIENSHPFYESPNTLFDVGASSEYLHDLCFDDHLIFTAPFPWYSTKVPGQRTRSPSHNDTAKSRHAPRLIRRFRILAAPRCTDNGASWELIGEDLEGTVTGDHSGTSVSLSAN